MLDAIDLAAELGMLWGGEAIARGAIAIVLGQGGIADELEHVLARLAEVWRSKLGLHFE